MQAFTFKLPRRKTRAKNPRSDQEKFRRLYWKARESLGVEDSIAKAAKRLKIPLETARELWRTPPS